MAGRQLFRRLFPAVVNCAKHQASVQRSSTLSASFLYPHIRVADSLVHRCMSTSPKFECVNIQDESDYEKTVIESKVPVVVDFYATWCGPCKLLGPRLESIIGSKNGKVMLAKVDIDLMPDLAIKSGVQAVPTVVAVKGGKILDTFVGLQEDDIIESFVEKLAQ